jgi:hypothetical protein
MKSNINLAILRTLFNQARGDLQWLITFGTFLLAASIKGFSIKWWYIALYVLAIFIHMIWGHYRRIRQDSDYARTQSKEYMELKRMVKEIHENIIGRTIK